MAAASSRGRVDAYAEDKGFVDEDASGLSDEKGTVQQRVVY